MDAGRRGWKERRLQWIGFLLTVFLLFAGTAAHAAQAAAGISADVLPAERRLPIIMYHSILDDPKKAQDYVITPDILEADLCWLRANGYTTVTVSDLIAFVAGRGTLPDKPVMLTFDDGYLNNRTYAEPLLQAYGMRAVISVVGSYTDRFTQTPDPNPLYAHLTWEDLIRMQENGVFEIQNHSYDMHALGPRRGSDRMAGESDGSYRCAFTEDTERMQRLLAEHGIAATTYTYPYGQVGAHTTEWLKELGFSVSMTCYEKMNLIRAGDPEGLFCLGRWNRPAGISTEAFMQKAVIGAE